ncbi:uncharacterized protein DUF3893 [Saccharothrix texasensis]|uniref:Uncharacterized protein DUF3893 n=1 Tax=Saccharothrix texasensis TaxID=103734 RepID=A0A3N1H3Z9_9PSEU|nr:uncharacterized protein DUF3893 [Saccharothrix texasensis]
MLYLAPPSFIERGPGHYLLLGIRPFGAPLIQDDLAGEIDYEGHTRLIPEGKPAGFASGLWCPRDAAGDNRVFASTADLPRSFPKTPRGLRKLGDDVSSQYGATVSAWNPQYLEITALCVVSGDAGSTDSAAEWASVAHQQRFHDEYDPLAQPFPVHLAKKAEEYCFSTGSNEDEAE